MTERHLLYGDERVLWEGAPPTGIRLRPRHAVTVPVFLVWTVFFAGWTVAATGGRGGWFALPWGIGFTLLGLYQSIGVLLHDAHVRGRRRYRVTDRRVLVERHGRRGDVRSLAIDRLPLIAMTERSDGSGDLRFEPKRYVPGKGGRPIERDADAPALGPLVQFLAIPDVAAVHDLIQEAAAARR